MDCTPRKADLADFFALTAAAAVDIHNVEIRLGPKATIYRSFLAPQTLLNMVLLSPILYLHPLM